ncbi:hypothetical protein P3T27_005888 [Kitasatospora sp. MAA19]|uniref:DUF317 domain-containing protein n=1 Tax=unclassified Kitasatospora TaxID=2633591 RepID=UPI0024755813|nr:DUF317 domain-containing protein [Kitasatospora sp. MAA19]MDH6709142.1 hypothetical protein [Kitasatospora sp. MAA19]
MSSAAPLLVQPLRLAGPGDQRLVTGPLAAAPGWSRARTPDGGVRFTSPCRIAVITGSGPPDRPGIWSVHGYTSAGSEPLWRALFGSGTPAEITAAFTTVLVDGLRSGHRDYLHGGPNHRPGTPASVLADRGWRPAQGPKGFHDQVAPDGSAVYRHRVGHQPADAEVAGLAPPAWPRRPGACSLAPLNALPGVRTSPVACRSTRSCAPPSPSAPPSPWNA